MNNIKPLGDIKDVSDATAKGALCCLGVFFLIIVTYGWATMFTPIFSLAHGSSEILVALLNFMKYIAGLAVAIAGVTLAKAVAAERLRISSGQNNKNINTWIAYFAVLLIISALGTMNTMFMQTQQTTALGDVITKTNGQLILLQKKINEKLATPSYDKLRINIDIKFRDFKAELKNPSNCGFGAQSNKNFQELQAILPTLKPLALGAGSCQNVDTIIAGYKESVEILKDELPEPNIKEYYRVRNTLNTVIENTLAKLNALKVNNLNLNKAAALPDLNEAWSSYSDILTKVETLSGSQLGLPSDITDKDAQGMGNITQILPLLIHNLNNLLTYLIIVSAILFDLLLIEFYSRYLSSKWTVKEEEKYSSSNNYSSSKAKNILEDR